MKRGHGGHHGSAWKVAYADFVTAMMALFMVLWIIGQSSEEAKDAIAGYFRRLGMFTTMGASRRKIAPIVPASTLNGESGSFNMLPAKPPQEVLTDILHRQQQAQEQTFKQVGEHLQARPAALPELQRLKDQVFIDITDEELRIELLDKEGSSFFEVGSAQFKSETIPVLRAIASEIRQLPNAVVIEGHTDSRPFALVTNPFQLGAVDRSSPQRQTTYGKFPNAGRPDRPRARLCRPQATLS